ncbi:Hsp20/alpha crystallin family protein [bacterium]|nr:MAG: Hsp20/alpha crystallin family protein [bacterium]
MSTLLNRPTAAALVEQIDAITHAGAWQPSTEVISTARGVTYYFDLPGVLPANLHLACRDGQLLVWGFRPALPDTAKTVAHSNTRRTGAFAASAVIPETLDPSRIWKEFKDGVLTVNLPTRRASLKRA